MRSYYTSRVQNGSTSNFYMVTQHRAELFHTGLDISSPPRRLPIAAVPGAGAVQRLRNLRHTARQESCHSGSAFLPAARRQRLSAHGPLGGNILNALPHVQRGARWLPQSKNPAGRPAAPHLQDAEASSANVLRVAHRRRQACRSLRPPYRSISHFGGASHGVDGKIPGEDPAAPAAQTARHQVVAAVVVLAIHTVGGDFWGAAHDEGNGASFPVKI